VVASAKSLADRHKGHASELGGEVHGDLTGESDILHATLGRHVRHLDAVVLGDFALDHFGRERVAGFFDEDVVEELLDLGQFDDRRRSGGRSSRRRNNNKAGVSLATPCPSRKRYSG